MTMLRITTTTTTTKIYKQYKKKKTNDIIIIVRHEDNDNHNNNDDTENDNDNDYNNNSNNNNNNNNNNNKQPQQQQQQQQQQHWMVHISDVVNIPFVRDAHPTLSDFLSSFSPEVSTRLNMAYRSLDPGIVINCTSLCATDALVYGYLLYVFININIYILYTCTY